MLTTYYAVAHSRMGDHGRSVHYADTLSASYGEAGIAALALGLRPSAVDVLELPDEVVRDIALGLLPTERTELMDRAKRVYGFGDS